MINQMNTNDHTENQFFHALKELQIAKLLRRANITKTCGVSAYEVFQFLLLLVFQGKNLFRFLNSKHKEQAVSKNTYYRFLNEVSYNWSRFLMLLAVKVTSAFDRLSRPERVNVLILDDSVIKRNRSKKWNCWHASMTMWNINSRKVLPCLRLAGQMDTALSRQVLICCLQPLKATVIMQFRIALTTEQTVIKFGRQV